MVPSRGQQSSIGGTTTIEWIILSIVGVCVVLIYVVSNFNDPFYD